MPRSVGAAIILLLILVGMFSISTQTLGKFIIVPERRASTLSLYAYKNVTTHEGDLIIGGTQTLAIENCTYIQTGNIYVRNEAKLSIRNAEVEMNQTYVEQFEFVVEDYATLELEDARLASGYSMNFKFIEHSNATFNKVILDMVGFVTFVNFNDYSKANLYDFLSVGLINLYFNDYSEAYIVNSAINYIMPTGACRVKASNSSIATLELWFPKGDVVEVHELRPGFSEYLDLKEKVSSRQAFDVELNNTSASWWLAACYDSTTRISDSVLAWFTVEVDSSISARFEDLEPRYYEFERVGEITLNRTSVTGALRVCMHAQDADCIISNSKVWLMASYNSRLYVVNSVIYGLNTHERNFVGSLYFDNATFPEGDLWFLTSDFYISGDISFGQLSIIWYSCNVMRDYDVMAKDRFGEPLTNAGLVLLSDDNVVIWNGTTDNQGEANFNVTFTDSNYTDTLRLDAVKGDKCGTTNVSFLSDTPVTVVLGRHDMAVTNAAPSKNIVGRGYDLRANVTVANQGDYFESSTSLSLYANTTGIGTQTVNYLWIGTNTTIIIDGAATSGLAYGNYTLSAYAWPVTGEMDTADNNCTCGQITITIPGDVDGDFRVQLQDLVILARVYGSKVGDSNWNPNTDINSNGVVDLADLVILTQHYGQHVP